jgi:hypothetical protein
MNIGISWTQCWISVSQWRLADIPTARAGECAVGTGDETLYTKNMAALDLAVFLRPYY